MERFTSEDNEFVENISNGIRKMKIKQSISPRHPLKDIPENGLKKENIYNETIKLENVEPKLEKSRGMVLLDDLSLPDQERYNAKVKEAKRLTKEGRVTDALRLNEKALKIFHTDGLARKIEKMKLFLEEHGESDDEGEGETGTCHLGQGFSLNAELYNKLYRHQKEGVLWLWGLYKKKKGGILGDDMGLGKTIQTVSFLSGMFDADRITSVLIVLPVSVMATWENEFEKWAPQVCVYCFHGNNKREREKVLARVQRRGGVLLTSYGMVVSNWEQLSYDFTWDYMILDEGHKIKNPTKTSKGVHAIESRNRIILTGTPVQNNLKELWALFNFVHHGSLLGTLRTFKMEYDTPITRAREKDASTGERAHGQNLAESLKAIITPYFLRRTKADVKTGGDPGDKTKNNLEAEMPTFTRKNDLILWVYMTDVQQKIYGDFLVSEQVKDLLMTTKSPLVALTVLKKICDHPRLLSTRACIELGLEKNRGLHDESTAHECAANRLEHVSDDVLMKEAGKLTVLIDLLDNLKVEGHRCLVFSQSRKLLDIIQRIITNRGHKVLRLDGTIIKMADRDYIVQKFQNNHTVNVLLLTTQVGGVGLTLTGADRVVIYDPSWNPATDAQAVDRVFRIGQNKNVVVYRFITCATVEEKIYRRQIFKDSITRQTTGGSTNPYRYFTKGELRDLFILDDPHSSSTQQQLQGLHQHNRDSDTQLDEHIAFLHTLEIYGISDHNLMFQDTPTDEVHEDPLDPDHSQYSQTRVEKAQKLLEMESSQAETMEAHHAMYFKHLNTARGQATKERPNRADAQKMPQLSSMHHNVDVSSDENEDERKVPESPDIHAVENTPSVETESETETASTMRDAVVESSDEDGLVEEKSKRRYNVVESSDEEIMSDAVDKVEDSFSELSIKHEVNQAGESDVICIDDSFQEEVIEAKMEHGTSSEEFSASVRRGPEDEEHRGPEDEEHRGPEDEEHRGPEDEEHRGPEDEEHRGPEDEEHRGPEDEEHRGPKNERDSGLNDSGADDIVAGNVSEGFRVGNSEHFGSNGDTAELSDYKAQQMRGVNEYGIVEDEQRVREGDFFIQQQTVDDTHKKCSPLPSQFSTPTSSHALDKARRTPVSKSRSKSDMTSRRFPEVVQEELLISPDCSRPIVNTVRKADQESQSLNKFSAKRRSSAGKLFVSENVVCDTPDMNVSDVDNGSTDDDSVERLEQTTELSGDDSIVLDTLKSSDGGVAGEKSSTNDGQPSVRRDSESDASSLDLLESSVDPAKQSESEGSEASESGDSFIDDENDGSGEETSDSYGSDESDEDGDSNDDDTVASLRAQAQKNYRRGRYSEALKDVLQALKVKPDDTPLQILACKIKQKQLQQINA